MKITLSILFVLLSFICSGQNINFSSIFQILEKDTIEIYHSKLSINVSSTLVIVSQEMKEKSVILFSFGVNFKTLDNNIYTNRDLKGNITTFVLNEQKLTITNPEFTYTIYGIIPRVVKTHK